MPIIKSAKKKLRQDKKRESYNLLVKKDIKAAVSGFKKKPSAKMLEKVYSLLYSAVKKNINHRNKSSRLKSRLSGLLGKKSSSTSPVKPAAKRVKAKKSS